MPTKNWGNITLDELTAEQTSILSKIQDQSNESLLIEGVAGSGKTILATFAVIELSKSNNSKLLVYTKVLKNFMRNHLNDNISGNLVNHYHNHIHQNQGQTYDTLIIDEAQDFDDEMREYVENNSNTQIWLGDQRQQIYESAAQANTLMKLSSKIPSANKLSLVTNFRNPINVVKFATKFLYLTPEEQKNGAILTEKRNDYVANVLRNIKNKNNDKVICIKAEDRKEEFDAIAKKINELLQKPSPSRIAIANFLHNRRDHVPFPEANLDTIDEELKKRGVNFSRIPLEFPNFATNKYVLLSPTHSLKGTEFEYIIFPFAEAAINWYDETIRDNLLYMLFTRTKRQLIISYVDEDNWIMDKFKDQLNTDFMVNINAQDILGDQDSITEETDDIDF